MKRNYLKYISFALLAAFSCNESEDLLTGDAIEGGLLEPTSSSLNYVVGQPEGPYNVGFLVKQGAVKTTEVRLYKSFVKTVTYTEVVDGEEVEMDTTFVSNEILQETIDVTDMKTHFINAAFTFSELADGLEIASLDGGPEALPTNDGEYQIGDRWVFRVESVLENGTVVQQSGPVNVAVSTRYAGTYKPVAAEYYRLGVLTTALSGWPSEVVIESVDATTYRLLEYWGPFNLNEILFQIEDGVITYLPDQLFNDQPMITCESDPASFLPAVHCGDTNYVINDEETGKDRLVMTNGYYTPGSGPRVMYQVLEKIVD